MIGTVVIDLSPEAVAIALPLIAMGYRLSGSEQSPKPNTVRLVFETNEFQGRRHATLQVANGHVLHAQLVFHDG